MTRGEKQNSLELLLLIIRSSYTNYQIKTNLKRRRRRYLLDTKKNKNKKNDININI